jgi:hypothetical protein
MSDCGCPPVPEVDGRLALTELIETDLALPGAPLKFHVWCNTAGEHEAVLQADWSLEMPHDPEAERTAAALGSSPCSCLALADRIVPAVRDWTGLQRRATLPPIAGSASERWRVTRPFACCAGTTYPTAAWALEHLRSQEHLVVSAGPDKDLLRTLLWAVEQAEATERLKPPTCRGIGRCVGPQTMLALWDAGLSPRTVCLVHRVVGAVQPLPLDFFLAVLGKQPDLSWIARTAASRTPALFHWLAETETPLDRAYPQARMDWLGSGVPVRGIPVLSLAGYRVDDALAVAAQFNISLKHGAELLLTWASEGLSPSSEDLQMLVANGLSPSLSVDMGELREVANKLRHEGATVDITRLAVATQRRGRQTRAIT